MSRVKQAGYFIEKQIIYLNQFTKDDLAKLLEIIITEKKIPRQYAWEQLIINYSNGLPGLAVTLLDTCIKTGGKEVFEGKSILTFLADISLETRSTIDWIKTKKILAWISLFGRSGIRLDQLSQILDIPMIEILSFLNSYQYSGIITEDHGRFWVRPKALRAVLVKEDLFNQDQFYHFLDSSNFNDASLDVILDAVRIGGSMPSAYLYSFLSKTTNTDLWIRFYSLFPESIDQGIKEHPNTREASIEPGLYNTPDMILPIVFEIASNDKRPLHSNPDHVLRKLENWLQAEPNSNKVIRKRKVVLQALAQFANSGGDPETIMSVICLVISPKYDFSEIPPGSGYKINYGTGLYSINLLKQFNEFWGQVNTILSTLPARLFFNLINSLYDWIYPSRIVQDLSSDFVNGVQEISELFIHDVAKIIKNHPVLVQQLEKLYVFLDKEIDFKVEIQPEILRIYNILFPDRDEYLKMDQNKQVEAINTLAKEFLSQDIDDVVEKISWTKDEAYFIHDPWPDLLPNLFSLISQDAEDPLKWYTTLVKKNLKNYTLPFINQIISKKIENWESIIHDLLKQDETIPLAIQTVFQLESPPIDLLKIVLVEVSNVNPHWIKTLCARDQVSESVVLHLLNHENEKIALAAALGEWYRAPHKNVRESLKKNWEKVISETTEFEYGLVDIFKEHPNLAFSWLSKAVSSIPDGFAGAEEKLIENVIPLLTIEDRKRLLQIIVSANKQRIHEIAQIRQLVSDSISLYEFLLEISNINDHLFYILSPLNKLPNNTTWPEMALLAIDQEVNIKNILSAAFQPQFYDVARVGELSNQYQEYVVAFEQLTHHENEIIRTIAEEGFEKAKKEVSENKERERYRDVYGWE
ncbi:MAG: hypothetical protein ACOWWR_03000 [Eubacteriales bacterium]